MILEIRSADIRPAGKMPALHLTFNFAHLLISGVRKWAIQR